MRVLIIDNRDSFVHNICGLLESVGKDNPDYCLEWDIVGCDYIDIESVHNYDAVILSPGPGIPSEAGRLMDMVKACAGRVPMLGICLGMQAIAEIYGGTLRQLEFPRHGHKSFLKCVDPADPIVGNLARRRTAVGRYHSWVVDLESLPDCLVASSFDEEGNIMSLRHRILPIFATQFHPESIISDCGLEIMEAFLEVARQG